VCCVWCYHSLVKQRCIWYVLLRRNQSFRVTAPLLRDRIETISAPLNQWRRSQVKSGDKYWEDWRGGVWEGLCPLELGVWGLPPEKKIIFAKNYAILSKFWYFFPILQQKVGIIPRSWKWGDLSLCPPPLLRRLCTKRLEEERTQPTEAGSDARTHGWLARRAD